MPASVGVVTFPGSLDDRDAQRAVRLAGAEPVALWHADADLHGVDAVVLPGGFSYGDYLRCGAIARFAQDHAAELVACRPRRACRCSASATASRSCARAHLLPGRANPQRPPLRFITAVDLRLRVERTRRRRMDPRLHREGDQIVIPLKSGEGAYAADTGHPRGPARGRAARSSLSLHRPPIPNGSADRDIAGVCNERRQRGRPDAASRARRSTPSPARPTDGLALLYLGRGGSPHMSHGDEVPGRHRHRWLRETPDLSRSRSPQLGLTEDDEYGTHPCPPWAAARPAAELALYSVMWSRALLVQVLQGAPASSSADKVPANASDALLDRASAPTPEWWTSVNGLRRHLQDRIAQSPVLRGTAPGRGHRRRRHRARHPRHGRTPDSRDGRDAGSGPPRRHDTARVLPGVVERHLVRTGTAWACPTSAARSCSTRRTTATRSSMPCA